MGRFHALSVHVPIGLLFSAFLAELLLIWKHKPYLAEAARFCLWVGAIGAVIAAPLGWAQAIGAHASYEGILVEVLEYHRWIGTTIAVLSLLALIACEVARLAGSRRATATYRVALFSCALLVVVQGHLGGTLVFGWGYLSG